MRLLGKHAGRAGVDRSIAEARKSGARLGLVAPTTCCQAGLDVADVERVRDRRLLGVEASSAKRSALREVVR